MVVKAGLVQVKARREVFGTMLGTLAAEVVRVRDRRARRSEIDGAGDIGIDRERYDLNKIG
jgi:hypothetical protein